MRAGRLLSILILLQLRVRLTADELAEEFEVSARTIYRDIEELSAAGVPIYGDRGPGGGFQLVDGYRTRLTGLAADEAEAVFLIGMPGAADALGLGAAAVSAGRKLLASLPPSMTEGAGRLGARFHLDPIDWYRAAAPVDHLPAMARAVLDARVVQMTYESWTGVRESRVEPLGLVLKAGAWYVVARGGGTARIYKIANIRAMAVDDLTFDRPDGFDLAAYWTAELQRFEASLRPALAVVRASPTGRDRVARLGAYAARAVQEAEPPDADGWARLRLPIEHLDQAALLLLGLGSEVEVLEPHPLRDRVRELARSVAQRHDCSREEPQTP
jgi:predicted DNA-binding transcriptional regulator YafY